MTPTVTISVSSSSGTLAQSCWDKIYQDCMVHKQNAGVSFEVDPFGLLYDLKPLDRDICLITETQAHEVEHGEDKRQSRRGLQQEEARARWTLSADNPGELRKFWRGS
jgi:hypothetical protein